MGIPSNPRAPVVGTACTLLALAACGLLAVVDDIASAARAGDRSAQERAGSTVTAFGNAGFVGGPAGAAIGIAARAGTGAQHDRPRLLSARA